MKFEGIDDQKWDTGTDVLDSIALWSHHKTINCCGCLSHPKAREWLMQDVIKELEKKVESMYDSRPCNKDDNGRMYNQDELNLMDEVIKLIKNGVDKK